MVLVFRKRRAVCGYICFDCFGKPYERLKSRIKALAIEYSSIAQSVERMTVNHDVTGSSPVRGAKIKSRHFCGKSKCRLFCRPKMCYNVINREGLAYLKR